MALKTLLPFRTLSIFAFVKISWQYFLRFITKIKASRFIFSDVIRTENNFDEYDILVSEDDEDDEEEVGVKSTTK